MPLNPHSTLHDFVSSQNKLLALTFFHYLLQKKVTHWCVCASSRNAPLVRVLMAHTHLCSIYYFYEERSAAFFALGQIKNRQCPVAITTTSGTAAGELLPATMEAYYSGLPLILVTADRPQKYRGSGAPQSAEQVDLYQTYVSYCFDLDHAEKIPWTIPWDNKRQPVHFNLCFDEPLLEESSYTTHPLHPLPHLLSHDKSKELQPEIQFKKIFNFLKTASNPIILIGMLEEKDQEAVITFLLQLNLPTYCEAISGIREDPRLHRIRIYFADQLLQRAQTQAYPINGIVRIGGIPTHRIWRDLENQKHLPVLSLNGLAFSGLSRPSLVISGNLIKILPFVQKYKKNFTLTHAPQPFLQFEKLLWNQFQSLLTETPTSEPAWISFCSEKIPTKSRIYLGNSLPIREWDLCASLKFKKFKPWASRGLNGIDGQISTFLGFSTPPQENWAILGDLTTLYDLAGPWILSQMQSTRITLVIINNKGGKIFERLFQQKEFQNHHSLQFKFLAQFWNMDYEQWIHPDSIPVQNNRNHRMIEIIPDDFSTQKFWGKYEKLLKISLKRSWSISSHSSPARKTKIKKSTPAH